MTKNIKMLALNSTLNKVVNDTVIFNFPILSRVPKTTKRVLDVGCGSGTMGKQIKQIMNCEAVGITYLESEVVAASQWMDKVILHDLNQDNSSLSELGKFDCIIACHVLEHLYYPQNLLQVLHQNLSPGGKLIVALPNVLYWKQRLEFMRGHFCYQDDGLMDRTHFRFFDWKTAQELLVESGYEILETEANGIFPLAGFRKIFPQLSTKVDEVMTHQYPGLFSLQFVLSCRSL